LAKVHGREGRPCWCIGHGWGLPGSPLLSNLRIRGPAVYQLQSMSGEEAGPPGVCTAKSSYGKTYWGVQRTTFVIDPDGRVAEILRKVKQAEHDTLVLAALEELRPPGF
jgi:hypothetical protein